MRRRMSTCIRSVAVGAAALAACVAAPAPVGAATGPVITGPFRPYFAPPFADSCPAP